MPELVYKDLAKLKRFKKDLDWFQANYEDLKQKYKGEFVAIKDKKIIDHDKDLNSLTQRLKGQIDSFVIEYINEIKSLYIL